MSSPQNPAPKKLYEPPVLLVYGNIPELTRVVGPFGNRDNGHLPGKIKTNLR